MKTINIDEDVENADWIKSVAKDREKDKSVKDEKQSEKTIKTQDLMKLFKKD